MLHICSADNLRGIRETPETYKYMLDNSNGVTSHPLIAARVCEWSSRPAVSICCDRATTRHQRSKHTHIDLPTYQPTYNARRAKTVHCVRCVCVKCYRVNESITNINNNNIPIGVVIKGNKRVFRIHCRFVYVVALCFFFVFGFIVFKQCVYASATTVVSVSFLNELPAY